MQITHTHTHVLLYCRLPAKALFFFTSNSSNLICRAGFLKVWSKKVSECVDCKMDQPRVWVWHRISAGSETVRRHDPGACSAFLFYLDVEDSFELDTALALILSRCIARQRWLKERNQTDKEPCRNRGIGWLLAICNGHSFSLLHCTHWHFLDLFLKRIHPPVYLKYSPFLATLCSLFTLTDALEACVFVDLWLSTRLCLLLGRSAGAPSE